MKKEWYQINIWINSIIFALMAIMAGCSVIPADSDTPPETDIRDRAEGEAVEETTVPEAPADVTEVYLEFLQGKRNVWIRNEFEHTVDDLCGTEDGFGFAFYDINGDHIPELHLIDGETYTYYPKFPKINYHKISKTP